MQASLPLKAIYGSLISTWRYVFHENRLDLGLSRLRSINSTRYFNGEKTLETGTNEYDWLGHGIYFWDNSPSRALEYAPLLKNNPGRAKRPIKKLAVIGAVINLGYCLDLLDYENLQFVKDSYEILVAINKTAGMPIPENRARGVFWEGRELYHNAGFREKDHIQLCICNPNCIKGYFLPKFEDENFPKVYNGPVK